LRCPSLLLVRDGRAVRRRLVAPALELGPVAVILRAIAVLDALQVVHRLAHAAILSFAHAVDRTAAFTPSSTSSRTHFCWPAIQRYSTTSLHPRSFCIATQIV